MVFEVPTLTEEKLKISTKYEIIGPDSVKRIKNYGLPFSDDNSKKGDLLVDFDIKFPANLSSESKDMLSELLPDSWLCILHFTFLFKSGTLDECLEIKLIMPFLKVP